MLTTLRRVLKADLYRIDARQGLGNLVSAFLFIPTFRYVALMRLCKEVRKSMLLKFSLYPVLLWWFSRLGFRLGIRIPLSCQIGEGLLIEHWGSIWVNPGVSMGRNCNIAHEVTLGWVGSGPKKGCPTIGDGVFLGPGSKVLGDVKVGNHALISANSVVLQDVPENGVVIGVPGRTFSTQGSHDVVKNQWAD